MQEILRHNVIERVTATEAEHTVSSCSLPSFAIHDRRSTQSVHFSVGNIGGSRS